MPLLEREDCAKLLSLVDSLSDGSYTREMGHDIVSLILKYDKLLVKKIESINGISHCIA